ncbi:MAG: 30S ribosomal protein S4 [Acidobacteriota bacterium]
MAKYTGSACRLCRREGAKLFLKGERCFKEKCAIEKRNYAPGQHGRRKIKSFGYGLQLREKQKVKRVYGILERQFRSTFKKAERARGITGENLLTLLERRLDNVIYRLGFGSSKSQARQLVTHGHILVNGRKVDIPSYSVRVGDEISIKEASRKNEGLQISLEGVKGRGIPAWLELEADRFRGKVIALPARQDIVLPIQEQLIVELYSK